MWDFADIYKKDQFAFSYLTLHEWNYKKLKGKKIKPFLEKYGYNKVAIYSLGSLGNLFLDETIKENIDVKYIIDKNNKMFPEKINNIPVIGLDAIEKQQEVDAIIVCHVFYYNTIADDLKKHGIKENKILSLNDIVFSI